MGQLLQDTAEKHGETLGLISCHQNKRLTFTQLYEESNRFAAGLRRIGLNYGDRVAIWAPNCVEWYISFMACARAGLITVSSGLYLQMWMVIVNNFRWE